MEKNLLENDTGNSILKICYLSDNPFRLETSRRILEDMESENIMCRKGNRFWTEDAEYIFVDCRNAKNYMGLYADQVIIDYRQPIIGIAQIITAMSCVPDSYQIIDDRQIRISDSYQTSAIYMAVQA